MAVTVPLQVLLTPGVAATTKVPVAEGSVSLNATPVRSPAAVVFGLLMVKVTVVVPFNGIEAAPKPLEIVGGATTVIDAFDVLPVPAVVSPGHQGQQVRLGHHADHLPIVAGDGQPADPVLAEHGGHRLVRGVRPDRHHAGGHDVPDVRVHDLSFARPGAAGKRRNSPGVRAARLEIVGRGNHWLW